MIGFDTKNIIVKNILSDSEIEDIYSHIEATPDDKKELVRVFSHMAYHNWLPSNVVETLTKAAQSTVDFPIILRETSFARYQNFEDGLPVQLTPHIDETFREPRLTFDLQLKSNIDWPIVVENREYTLKDNEALTFSGTHQVHWRTKRSFSDGEFMDMVFCHFSKADYVKEELGPYTENHNEKSKHDLIMIDKLEYWTKVYNES